MSSTAVMDFMWAIVHQAVSSGLLVIVFLGAAIVLEVYSGKNNNAHVDEYIVFEDPNSLKPVPCSYIKDPAQNYMPLIIPTYNEEFRLPGALDETINYLRRRASMDKDFTYEIVIVDDGSTDGTKSVAFKYVRKYSVDNVRVILLGKNCGKGEAIKKGTLHSRGELLLMLDADGATKVTDLEKLENQLLERIINLMDWSLDTNSSILRISDIPISAFGSRAHLEQKALARQKWYRNFLMKGFHIVVLLGAGPGIRDTQCGFKMFTRSSGRKLFTNIRLKRKLKWSRFGGRENAGKKWEGDIVLNILELRRYWDHS